MEPPLSNGMAFSLSLSLSLSVRFLSLSVTCAVNEGTFPSFPALLVQPPLPFPSKLSQVVPPLPPPPSLFHPLNSPRVQNYPPQFTTLSPSCRVPLTVLYDRKGAPPGFTAHRIDAFSQPIVESEGGSDEIPLRKKIITAEAAEGG